MWSEVELSEHVPTVATVWWGVNGVDPRKAEVEFQRTAGGAVLVAPAPLTNDGPHRSLLLGMKASTEYTYRINVNDGACVSEPRTLQTGPASPHLPRLTFQVGSSFAPGFYILCSGFGADIPTGAVGPARFVYIIDQDGDPVWWWNPAHASSRATMDWEGNSMYMLALNVGGASPAFARVNMDGTGYRKIDIGNAHHDFTVTPDGRIVVIVHAGKSDGVVAYDPKTDTLSAIVPDVASLYEKGRPEYHANAITYRRDDDSFILGDRFPNLLVKFDWQGQLLWQFGGDDPRGPAFAGTDSWNSNHGHHWTDDGRLLVFNNGAVATSKVLQFEVDEANLDARLSREYFTPGLSSLVLGDVQQLPNQHVLATFSASGHLIEYNPEGEIVTHLRASMSLGYTMYRRTLYGPPDK